MNTPVTNPSTNSNNHWGLWATLVLSVLVFTVFSIIQSFALLAYVFSVDPEAINTLSDPDSTTGTSQVFNKYLLNGDAIAVAEIPAAIIGVAMILWLAWLRKPLTIDQYLSLNPPSLKSLLQFLGLMIVMMMAMEAVNVWLDRPTPDFMLKVYASTQNLPLLWIAVSVAAPFFEEFLFRGFFLEGLSRSKLGVAGAIILTSAAWAIIHMQYGWFEIISIFFIGIALCIAKIKTNSLYVPIAMHMLMNFAASVGMELSQ